MLRNFWKLFSFVLLFSLAPCLLPLDPTFAQGQAGQAAPFLYFGVGAKALSMGGAFAGLANDATAGYWNPAGLTQLKTDEISTMHTELFLDIKYDYIGYAHVLKKVRSEKLEVGSENSFNPELPTSNQTLALSLLRLDAGTQEARDQFKNVTGILSANDFALLLSYSQLLTSNSKLSIGGNFKYIKQKIGGADGTGYALDAGVLYPYNESLTLGLTLQHLIATNIDWSTGAKDDLPIILRLGGAYTLPQGEKNAFTFTLDLEKIQHQDDFIFHLGGEYSFSNLAALRLGLDDENFTAGLGVTYEQYTIDYALVTHEELGNKHRISVGALF